MELGTVKELGLCLQRKKKWIQRHHRGLSITKFIWKKISLELWVINKKILLIHDQSLLNQISYDINHFFLCAALLDMDANSHNCIASMRLWFKHRGLSLNFSFAKSASGRNVKSLLWPGCYRNVFPWELFVSFEGRLFASSKEALLCLPFSCKSFI